MTYARDAFDTLPRMPSWVTSGWQDSPEDVAFLSGAALAHLHVVLGRRGVPQRLLMQRLALRAAEACVTHQGRPERAEALRDAVAFLQPGDNPGPAGDIYLSWQRAVERPVSVKTLHRALPEVPPDRIAAWMEAGQGGAVPRAAAVVKAVLTDDPRAIPTALMLADAALSQALGWRHVVPLLGMGLKRGDLRKDGTDLQLACHRAIGAVAADTAREATDLTRRAARLHAVAPKLRAKGAEEAVALFLCREAVAPTSLTSLRSDRAARRFCDRLVELGAVRELTGATPSGFTGSEHGQGPCRDRA